MIYTIEDLEKIERPAKNTIIEDIGYPYQDAPALLRCIETIRIYHVAMEPLIKLVRREYSSVLDAAFTFTDSAPEQLEALRLLLPQFPDPDERPSEVDSFRYDVITGKFGRVDIEVGISDEF